jgi:hypothetical protein
VAAGADRLFRRSLSVMRQWANYDPDQARPRSEIARVFLVRRAQAGASSPDRLKDLADSALAYGTSALALRTDTVPEDLLGIAGLHLGAGQADQALELTDRVLESRGLDLSNLGFPLKIAVSVYLATGHPSKALAIAEVNAGETFSPDPDADKFSVIPWAGVEPIVARAAVLGAAGIAGPVLAAEFDAIEARWLGVGYGPRELAILHRGATAELVISLSLDRTILHDWARDLDLAEPLWEALLLADSSPELARLKMLQAREVPWMGISAATASFLHGVVATRIGAHGMAIADFTRLDSLPHRVDRDDYGWGLQRLSFLIRGRMFERIGDLDRATESYLRFIAAWSPSNDPLIEPLMREAQAAIERLGSGSQPSNRNDSH